MPITVANDIDNQHDELAALKRSLGWIISERDEAARMADNISPELWGENKTLIISILTDVSDGNEESALSKIKQIIP